MLHRSVFQPCLLLTTLTLAVTTTAVQASESVSATEQQATIERISITQMRQPFRGDVPLQEQPQAVESLSSWQLSDLGITDLSSALDLSGGISRQNNFGGLWSSFAIRGFSGDDNVPSGYLVNGYNSGRGFGGIRDTTSIQSIEIMKGPGSALYGRTEPGGTINIITKKPQFSEQGYLQLSAGRWDQYRVAADYTNAVSDSVAWRVNGAYEDKGSFRVPITARKLALTPSLLWLVNDSTRINYELEYLDQELPFDRGVVALNNDPSALPVTRFLGEPSDGANQVDVIAHQLTLQHEFDDWLLLAGINYRDTELSGFSSDAELVRGRQQLFVDGETLSRQHSYRDFSTADYSARLELSGNFNTGFLRHHVLLGIDGYHFSFDKYWLRYRPVAGDTRYAIDIFKPVYGAEAPEPSLLYDQTEKQESYGIYLQDQVQLSDRWQLLLGGRFDDFQQNISNHKTLTVSRQKQTVFSPRVGLVYQLNSAVNLYANYAEGFRPNTGADAYGTAFAPEDTYSYELGSKFDGGWVSGAVALFHAKKSNVLTADPVNSGFSATLGEADSQGVELDLAADLTRSTRLAVSYAYTDAATANDVVNADWGVNIAKGSRLINIAKHSGHLTLTHDTDFLAKRLTVGGTLQYVGERLGETIDPNYVLPDYTLVNLFGQYAIADHLTLQLNVTNLFDRTYYPSSYSALWTMPGEPRSYKISARYDF